ncbi:hypothetical protein PPSIR1_17905 [Plesiocystis pacifica SIR-1]|uniref:Uncharacterized protein n=1 Tax=Plesiocystis pacifica SIR-1 TaxID=391625 RepID=A6GIY5_9BACT|nr:hypothetical protein [Plesiocystis pacifica]EDM74182.1 hypothetical protein PPSIR1_17905 [Plesiocystis pacifica SIR-1]
MSAASERAASFQIETKGLELVTVEPPPADQRRARDARFALPGEKRSRYSLPTALESGSPVGYRSRVGLSREEGEAALQLLSLKPPTGFAEAGAHSSAVREAELFEESALGIMCARQSTNYRGHRQLSFGPEDSVRIAALLRRLQGLEVPVLDGAAYTHLVLSRPYRTPFTLLLTFIGHKPVRSLLSVPKRAYDKRMRGATDIPTIGYLQDLHLGILADTLERAVVVASEGQRRAQIFQAPFCAAQAEANRSVIRELEGLCKLSGEDRRAGWRIAMVAQVGQALPEEAITLPPALEQGGLWRKLGANLLAFRSERIQPGVNFEPKAPPPYRERQDMDVPEEFTVQAGRAAYNAFSRWTGCERERAKELLLLDRVDVLTPDGKTRLRKIRDKLELITDRVVAEIPKWADVPLGKALSRNAERGRKAFALAGQRIYIAGLSKDEVASAGLDWQLAVRGVGAASCRSGLYAELMGIVELPEGCDLLAGICMMAGPVNQDDIGKTHFGMPDMLLDNPAFDGRDPTSLLVWTLKAKTVADPVGNEEQLLNAARKGALVDLRPAPHEVVSVSRGGHLKPMRARDGKHNRERAFADIDNFVRDHEGVEIPGNRGEAWPQAWSDETVW